MWERKGENGNFSIQDINRAFIFLLSGLLLELFFNGEWFK